MLAEFAENGAIKCAGLDVKRYTELELIERIGADFELIKTEYITYINPFNQERPYIYTLFKRVKI